MGTIASLPKSVDIVLQDGYLLTWTGCDGSYHEEEIEDLCKAQQRAVMLSEHGGHCITVADVDGNTFDF